MQLALNAGLQTDCMVVTDWHVPAPMVRLPDSPMYAHMALGYGVVTLVVSMKKHSWHHLEVPLSPALPTEEEEEEPLHLSYTNQLTRAICRKTHVQTIPK